MLSDLIKDLKNNRYQMPVWLGVIIARVPYSLRPFVGKLYHKRMKQLHDYENMSTEERKELIFRQMHDLVSYSISNIPFYKRFYASKGFSLDMLKTFDDIQKIPVITKEDLLKCDLDERSNTGLDKLLVNTGGSTGRTLSFYIQPSAIPHEAVYVSSMWAQLGYKMSDIRLGFGKTDKGAEYNFARNNYVINMYESYDDNIAKLMSLLKKKPCKYLHGYPSVISVFADYCQKKPELLTLLKKGLKGVFLCSEYPYPVYRDKIEKVFEVPTQAFYGHTERCVMAYEKKGIRNLYNTFPTYGYPEAVKRDDGHFDLIGTSYFNYASPLIRYNTKDIIDNPIWEGGILNQFEIIEGRSGQFVKDKEGNEISLTGLIMGRHHELFNYCDHIQIAQNELGRAVVLYVPRQGVTIDNPESLFDGKGVNIDFDFVKLEEPIRTVSGKVLLLVKYNPGKKE